MTPFRTAITRRYRIAPIWKPSWHPFRASLRITRPVLVGLSLAVLSASVTVVPSAMATPCLTRMEAKHHWPNSHLWWHTENRCWDNHPKGADHYDERAPL